MNSNRTALWRHLAVVSGALLASSAALAQPAAAASSDPSQAAYKKQVDSCNNGTSNEDRATCLKEAGAALAEARKGKLDEPNKNFKQNATERCDALNGDDRDACMARMKGQGATEGTVSTGGIVRELRTTKAASAPGATAPAK